MSISFTNTDFSNNMLNQNKVKELYSGKREVMTNDLFDELKKEFETFNLLPDLLKSNARLSLVGGSIRDLLLEDNIKDLDFLITMPSSIKITEEFVDIFNTLPQDRKDFFRENFRKYLVEESVIFTNQPLGEKEMWKYIIASRKDEVYNYNEDGTFNIDDLFKNIETEDELRKKYEPDEEHKDGSFRNSQKRLALVNFNETSIEFFSFLLSETYANLLKNENEIEAFSTTDEFLVTNISKMREKEFIKHNNKNGKNYRFSESEIDADTEEYNRLMSYASIKGIKSVIKSRSKGNSRYSEKDFIFSFITPDDFIKSFDFHVLENFITVDEKLFNDPNNVLKSINFSHQSREDWINKQLTYKFIEDEMEFPGNRLSRAKERLSKNFRKFEGYEFCAKLKGNDDIWIYKKEDTNSFVSYSAEELKKKKINIELYSLLVSFTLNIILNDNAEKNMQNLNNEQKDTSVLKL